MDVSLTRFRPLTTMLAALIALTVVLIGTFLFRSTHLPALMDVKAHVMTLPNVSVEVAPFTDDYTSVRLRSVFYASRGFYVQPPPDMTVPTLPKPNYRLTGTMTIPNKPRMAMLMQEETNVARKVTEGDDLDGWQVQSIDATRVVVKFGGETVEIASKKNGVSTGLLVRPLISASTASASVGIKSLSRGGVAAVNTAPIITTPRLYRPPSP